MQSVESFPTIVGVGDAYPDRIITNAELIEMTGIESTPDWIEEHTGIAQRHWVEKGEYSSHLAVRASRIALKMAGVEPEDVANFFLATSTPDYPSPNTSSLVHKTLGMSERCFALDINAACAGSLIGLSLASDRLMSQENNDPSLVVGAEITSRGANPSDRRTVIIFGDGAGAAVVRRVPGASRPLFEAMTQPNMEAFNVPAGGLVEPQHGADDPRRMIHMKGKEVAMHAFDVMTKAPERVAEKAGLYNAKTGIDWDGIDYFIPHQANGALIQVVAETLKIPDEKVINTIREQGNTSSASILVALSEAHRRGQVKSGLYRVLFTAIGAGFVGGAALMDISLS